MSLWPLSKSGGVNIEGSATADGNAFSHPLQSGPSSDDRDDLLLNIKTPESLLPLDKPQFSTSQSKGDNSFRKEQWMHLNGWQVSIESLCLSTTQIGEAPKVTITLFRLNRLFGSAPYRQHRPLQLL